MLQRLSTLAIILGAPHIPPMQISDHEKALSVFETYELELFFKLKEGGRIHGNTVKRIRKAIESVGVSKQFAEQFLHEQTLDMFQQIEEQEGMG